MPEVIPIVCGGVGWRCNRHWEGNDRTEKLWMYALTLGEIGPRGRGGDPDRQRTAVELGEVKGSSEGAGDESANGKDRRESDHCGTVRASRDNRESRAFTEERTERIVVEPSSFLLVELVTLGLSMWGPATLCNFCFRRLTFPRGSVAGYVHAGLWVTSWLGC